MLDCWIEIYTLSIYEYDSDKFMHYDFNHCCGSVSFWYGSSSPDPDPRIRLQIWPKIGKIFWKKWLIFSWFRLISVEIFHDLGWFFATWIQIWQKLKRIRIQNTDFNYSDYIRIFALNMVYKFFRCIKGLITNFQFCFSFLILHEAYIWSIY